MFPAILIRSRSEALMISRICDLEAPEQQGLERLAAGQGRERPFCVEASRDDAEPGAQSAVV
jgi:hypothetical protein